MKLRRILPVVLLLAVFLLWQNSSIQTPRTTVSLPQLPAAFSGLRVVELADLHGRSFGRDNRRLLRALRRLQPDIICIDGDFFDEKTDLSMVAPLAAQLCAIAPTFYVTGNHEWRVGTLSQVLAAMREQGVTVLRNDYRLLRRGSERIVIAGVDDPNGPADQKTPEQLVEQIRREQGQDVFILMLAHRNDTMSLWSSLGVQLVLTGHCHGGVIRLPLLGGVFGAGETFFPDYDAGLYREGDTALYVSRGLGYSRCRFRLFNRPELSLLVLQN